MSDESIERDATLTARLLLSAQLQAWAPSDEDIAWLVEQAVLRADDWVALADAVDEYEEPALCFDPRWHD